MFYLDSMSLGTALRLLRARQGLTQGVVATRAGLTKAMLSSYEIGAKLPSFQSLAAVLEALNRDFHDLQEALDEVRQRLPDASGAPVNPLYLGQALRLLRSRLGVTQVSIAERAGLTKAMLSCYETGSQLPSMQSLASTLKALGGDFHQLQEALDEVRAQDPEAEAKAVRPAKKPRKRRQKALSEA